MLEDMFETQRGMYQLNLETGLFTLRDGSSTPKLFLGSVDPQWEVYLPDNGLWPIDRVGPRYRDAVLVFNFLKLHTKGFTPDFREGYLPFGITCEPKDIALVGQGRIEFSDGFRQRLEQKDPSIRVELASKMDKVYRQLQNQERQYRVVS